ncbi:MAG TPA: hypothetical protein PKN48_00910 [Bacteroidales bacterium]|nr:hypothetical protein [Bacteroidales bacterium]
MHKVAVTADQIMAGKSIFNIANKGTYRRIMMEQPDVKKVLKFFGKIDKKLENAGGDLFIKQHGYGSLRKNLRDQFNLNFMKNYDTSLGTVIKSNTGKKSIVLNSKFFDLPKKERRNILHHEAFHVKNPILGKSEILAHMYGNYKTKDSIVAGIAHLIKTRPDRFLLEAIPLAGVVAGTGLITKKVIGD